MRHSTLTPNPLLFTIALLGALCRPAAAQEQFETLDPGPLPTVLPAKPLPFDWRRDPFSLGAYSWVPVGQLGRQQDLGAAVDKTMFFAGEATSQEMSGTVHGAIESGCRAAGEALSALPS